MKRHQCELKVPRPQSEKADTKQQAEWQKRLSTSLIECEVSQKNRWYFSDEMRFGLWGQVRQPWGVRGVKIIQPKQIQ